jgi:hypothetical protein
MSRLSARPLATWPAGANGVDVAGAVFDAGWGAWVEIVASADTAITLAGVNYQRINSPYATDLQVGVGGAGAETPIATLRDCSTSVYGSPCTHWLEVPIAGIAAGARISVRLRTYTSSTARGYVTLLGYEGGAYDDPDHVTTAPTLPSNFDTYPAAAPSATTPASTWAWSSWVELSSGYAEACGIFALHLTGGGGAAYEIQIGVGAAGAEAPIASYRDTCYANYAWYNAQCRLPGTYLVPAGTRIVARVRSSSASALTFGNLSFDAYRPFSPAPPAPPEEYEPDPDVDVTGETIGLTWVELRDADDALHVRSDVDLADPADYYGGFKAATVLSWGPIRRALSNYRGEPQGTTFRWRLSDGDRFWRGLLADDLIQINLSAVIRTISDEARRALQLARTIVRGLVRRWKLPSPLEFEFEAEDTLSRLLTTKVPRRLITITDFPGAVLTDANGTAPMPCVGQPVPIVFGAYTDEQASVTPGTALTTPVLVDVTVVGGTPGVTKRYALTLGNSDYAVPLGAWADHRGETDPLWVTVTDAPTDEDIIADPDNHYIVISVEHQAGATRGRTYGRYPNSQAYGLDGLDAPGAWGIVPAGVWQYWEGKRPYGLPDWNRLKYTGTPPTTNNTGGTTVDTGRGVVAPIYVGQLDGYHCWVVACHACAGPQPIPSWYVDGVRQAAATAGAGAAWLIPGYAGWTAAFGTALYRDINSHRYTLIFGRVGYSDPDDCAAGEKVLTINVRGFDTVGDGTGELITSLPLQYLHVLKNFGFQDYQSGAWLDSPAFPADPAPEDGDYIRMIDEESFERAALRSEARVYGGYQGAGIIGEDGQLLLRDVVARFNQNCDVDDGRDRKTRFFIDMESEDSAQLETAIRYTQERDIREDSFEVSDDDTELFTVRPYAFGYDAARRTWAVDSEMRDQASIDAMAGEERIAQRLDLYFVRDQATAEDIVTRNLDRSKRPPRRVRWVTGLGGLSSELGDIALVTHTDGPDHGGWVDRPVRVREHQFRPGSCEVELVGRDQRHIPWSS